jgi:ribonuclease Y
MDQALTLPLALVGLLVGTLLGVLGRSWIGRSRLTLLEQRARERDIEAQHRLKSVEVEVRERLQQAREEGDREIRTARSQLELRERDLAQLERDLQSRDRAVARKEGEIVGREDRLAKAEEAVRSRIREAEAKAREAAQRLESLAGLTVDSARTLIMRQAEEEARTAAGRAAAVIRESAVRDAEREARRIIGLAIQRLASDQTIETTVTVVTLPSDDMKGRIIGREGRNIRAFEMATGVDVIIDDTPEAVLLSSFDPVRREIARRSLVRLIEDGRIHPGRIEEVVQKAEEELRSEHHVGGAQAALEVGVPALALEVLEVLGRLEYRTSFGQNVLRHCVEVGHLAGLIAGELQLDPAVARRAGLLHDLGKALDEDHVGSHALAGAELLKRVGERPEVIEAVAAHHAEIEAHTPFAWIVQAADAISSSRPGARREKLETYLKRLEQLEAMAGGFPGVERSFAIQAGRELRVLVQSREVGDGDAASLAAAIAARIEKEMQYPGQIKVVVIRELRAIDYAR